MFDRVLRSKTVVTPNSTSPAAIAIKNGIIEGIFPFDEVLETKEDLTLNEALLPGVVDTHVHINEPGRTEWEGFTTATNAAAAGGVTTVIDMPLNSIPPTVSVDALKTKQAAAKDKCRIDVGFWGGAIPGNLSHLIPLQNSGVFGFKSFLLHSGVDEFPAISLPELKEAMNTLAPVDGLLIIHAEDDSTISNSPSPNSKNYEDFLNSRPRSAENIAIANVINLAQETGARVHILHLSSAEALDMIVKAKAAGIKISAETCPHYLSLSAEEVSEGLTQYKCCPPIREQENQDKLWEGVLSGVIDFIASDHSPCTPDLKVPELGDFQKAWGGISSLELGLSIIWTAGARYNITLSDLAQWLSTKPAQFAGVSGKGSISVGNDADIIAFDPEHVREIDAAKLHHRNPVSPYNGKHLRGYVTHTWLRGTLIYQQGEFKGAPQGKFLNKGVRV